jgi:hydrogenase maturation protein HypF
MGSIAASPEVSPLTSSMGRLFDAVGALCGFGVRASYEGQAAVEFEAAAHAAGRPADDREYEIGLAGSVLDPRAAVRRAATELSRGTPAQLVALRFHRAVAAATVRALTEIAAARGLETVVLSGGVFQNRLLLESVHGALEREGLHVLVPERLPCNDGGISFGQAAVAAAALA